MTFTEFSQRHAPHISAVPMSHDGFPAAPRERSDTRWHDGARRQSRPPRPEGLPHSTSWCIKLRNKVGCAQCAHLGLRIRLGRRRTGPDWGGFRGRPVFFKGWRPVRVPPRAQCFRRSVAFFASECAHFVHLWAPSGAFFIVGRWCGQLPPCLPGWTGCCSIPVHGRSWSGQHDLGKIWWELLYRIVGCSPGSSWWASLAVLLHGGCGGGRHDVRPTGRETCAAGP